jgi:hypothetical protein
VFNPNHRDPREAQMFRRFIDDRNIEKIFADVDPDNWPTRS